MARAFPEQCTCCSKYIVWQEHMEWFCFYCSKQNTTAWRCSSCSNRPSSETRKTGHTNTAGQRGHSSPGPVDPELLAKKGEEVAKARARYKALVLQRVQQKRKRLEKQKKRTWTDQDADGSGIRKTLRTPFKQESYSDFQAQFSSQDAESASTDPAALVNGAGFQNPLSSFSPRMSLKPLSPVPCPVAGSTGSTGKVDRANKEVDKVSNRVNKAGGRKARGKGPSPMSGHVRRLLESSGLKLSELQELFGHHQAPPNSEATGVGSAAGGVAPGKVLRGPLPRADDFGPVSRGAANSGADAAYLDRAGAFAGGFAEEEAAEDERAWNEARRAVPAARSVRSGGTGTAARSPSSMLGKLFGSLGLRAEKPSGGEGDGGGFGQANDHGHDAPPLPFAETERQFEGGGGGGDKGSPLQAAEAARQAEQERRRGEAANSPVIEIDAARDEEEFDRQREGRPAMSMPMHQFSPPSHHQVIESFFSSPAAQNRGALARAGESGGGGTGSSSPVETISAEREGSSSPRDQSTLPSRSTRPHPDTLWGKKIPKSLLASKDITTRAMLHRLVADSHTGKGHALTGTGTTNDAPQQDLVQEISGFEDIEEFDIEDIDLNAHVPLRVGNTSSSLLEGARPAGSDGLFVKRRVGNFLSEEDNKRNFFGLESDASEGEISSGNDEA